jgi:GNAT superfamily N-acetyltransferase
MRKATQNDIPLLVTMMTEFYSHSPYTLNARRATDAFAALLADERLGHIWFVQSNLKDVGYVVVTFCFSMNFGGPIAIIDDFYIQRAFRGTGLGKATMQEVRDYCISHELRAIQVETGQDNGPALAVYRNAGLVNSDHLHLSMPLAAPTHAT